MPVPVTAAVVPPPVAVVSVGVVTGSVSIGFGLGFGAGTVTVTCRLTPAARSALDLRALRTTLRGLRRRRLRRSPRWGSSRQ